MKVYRLIIKDENPINDMEIDFLCEKVANKYKEKCIKQGYKSVEIKQIIQNVFGVD